MFLIQQFQVRDIRIGLEIEGKLWAMFAGAIPG